MTLISNGSYRVLGQRLCRKAFQLLHCVRAGTLTKISKAVSEGSEFIPPPKKRRTSGIEKPLTELQKRFYSSFGEIVDLLGETMPHMSKKNKNGGDDLPLILLPSSLYSCKKDVLEDMVTLGMLPEGYKYSLFTRCWRRYFPNVLLKSWNPFAKCDECTKFRSQLLRLYKTNSEAVAQLKVKQKLHRDLTKYSRDRLADREYLAAKHPDKFLFMIIDGMDCQKAQAPRCRSDATFCKDLEGTGKPLKSKLIGSLMPGRGFMTFWVLPRFPSDPNLTATLFLKTLREVSITLKQS